MPFSNTHKNKPLTSALLAASLLVGACGSSGTAELAEPVVEDVAGNNVEVSAEAGFFDSGAVHDLVIDFDQDDYDEMILTYLDEGEKDWIEATVTVDGVTFENVGVRLKGNSSLFGLTTATSGNPEDLPWLIKFDKYVDDQSFRGINDIVIRSNSTETALNEAVAQELLELAGLAFQDPVATTFTVNGSEIELRLAIEHPDEIWEEANFDSDESALYKADSTGDYSYRGTDWETYEDIFDQKVGDDDLEPLIDFLDFINNSDDATFADELGEHLDIDSFATYLAFQDLVGNADDIDGRGNNSYLQYDYDTDQFTVVSWDLNLAFDTANVGGGGDARENQAVPGGRPERTAPTGDEAVDGEVQAGRAAGGQGAGGSNVLSARFLADDGFATLYDLAVADLTETLFISGAAGEIVSEWIELLSGEASALVSEATIGSEAAAIAAEFPVTQ